MPVATQSDLGTWRAVHPAEGASWLAMLTVPWWVAGGWALDLFMGRQSRPHADLDIGVLRRDALDVLAALSSWQIFEAKAGVLTEILAGAIPDLGVNALWCRSKGTGTFLLELMLDESAGDDWVFRRCPDIKRPLAAAVRRTQDGLPYLAPEIQLLYKAKKPRERDQIDFVSVAPRLDTEGRQWLRQALVRSAPGHPWIARL
jgi:hypothetical protein